VLREDIIPYLPERYLLDFREVKVLRQNPLDFLLFYKPVDLHLILGSQLGKKKFEVFNFYE
jgi:hypothetical protein